ncbi:MAG: XRE family transcriptional regulator [Candidatus Latescibacterota bacterium]|jgi:transcriptional regulator with XRE-family HTH domain|tara:strand:+ start:674 stop:985 length:312 start_codon:yes stop_codon:yes gene_type:complete
MAKSFKNLLDRLPPDRLENIENRSQGMLLEMALQEIRQKRQLTQQQLASDLDLNQAAISKMENQSDIHVSTLRKIVTAMGGHLKLVVQFPDEEIVINQFYSSK